MKRSSNRGERLTRPSVDPARQVRPEVLLDQRHDPVRIVLAVNVEDAQPKRLGSLDDLLRQQAVPLDPVALGPLGVADPRDREASRAWQCRKLLLPKLLGRDQEDRLTWRVDQRCDT